MSERWTELGLPGTLPQPEEEKLPEADFSSGLKAEGVFAHQGKKEL